MAELTVLESKLAEVLGLASAARAATGKVKGMLDEDERDLASELERMSEEARETEERCTDVAGQLDGKKTAIIEKSREVKQEASEMMSTYLADEEDALDGFEFLTMAEAGEVGHWRIVEKLNEQVQNPSITELAKWAVPIQERHLKTVLEGSLVLASREDPNAPEEQKSVGCVQSGRRLPVARLNRREPLELTSMLLGRDDRAQEAVGGRSAYPSSRRFSGWTAGPSSTAPSISNREP
jgi:hypothetical protein